MTFQREEISRDKKPDNQDITFVLIAFGDSYINYATNLIRSMSVHIKNPFDVLVFTDNRSEFESIEKSIATVKVVMTESLQWPEATAYRYELIAANSHLLNSEFCFYLDADSLFLSKFDISDLGMSSSNLVMVHHPGFYGRGFIFNIYKKYFKCAWEAKYKSTSRVPFWKRGKYVCGGFWGGARLEFLSLCSELRIRTSLDLESNFYPRSYDESYLNWYFANNRQIKLLTPKYGYVSKFRTNSKYISNPVIAFLEKTDEEVAEKLKNDKN